MKKLPLLIIALFFVFAVSCNSGGKVDSGLLPMAKSKPGEIILVMDSAKWKGALGEQVRNVFEPAVEGLPRPEALFTIRYIDPRYLNGVLKAVKNMIFITTLDSRSHGSKIINNYFTAESRKKIKGNPDVFISTDKNVFARGQEVMYLFSPDETTLIDHLKKNKEKLQGHFNSIENSRLLKSMYKAKEVKGIENVLQKDYQCFLRVPFGFQLVQQEEGFIWTRRIDTQVDRDVFIAYKPFTNENDLTKESVIAFRESITQKYIFDDPDKPDTYVTLQPDTPLLQREINFNHKYAIETKGLWKTNNNSMGGPFLSYAFVDEALNRMYYIEGFVYSPAKSQREIMREIEVILSTFKTRDELAQESK